jgi:hypothetical protein
LAIARFPVRDGQFNTAPATAAAPDVLGHVAGGDNQLTALAQELRLVAGCVQERVADAAPPKLR